jgi:hypothetical protein
MVMIRSLAIVIQTSKLNFELMSLLIKMLNF